MTRANITIDPLSSAMSVENPEIKEVLDLATGEYRLAAELIRSFRYDHLIAERVRVRSSLQAAPAYKCAICPSAVYLVSTPEKRFFFRHRHEDGSCPSQTRDALGRDQILARKYHGLRESEPHKRIKRLVERSLLADVRFQSQSINREKRWYVSEDRTQWRQPDVQALWGDRRIAFEAQLSTTFLDVVVGRREDYRAGGVQLIWIMSGFDPEYRRLTTDDILFSNNSNIFVVDEESCRLSEEHKEFYLRCHYREAYREDGLLNERWAERLVKFSELTLEKDTQRAFYFDFEAEEQRLRSAIDGELRAEFFAFWTENMKPYCRPGVLEAWQTIRQKMADRSVPIPERPDGNTSFSTMVHGMLSAANGEPTGWQFHKLVQVAHHIAEMYPQHILAFGHALTVSRMTGVIESQDSRGKWRRRSEELKGRLRRGDVNVMPDREWLAALCFLFPDVGARVVRFLSKLESDPVRLASA